MKVDFRFINKKTYMSDNKLTDNDLKEIKSLSKQDVVLVAKVSFQLDSIEMNFKEDKSLKERIKKFVPGRWGKNVKTILVENDFSVKEENGSIIATVSYILESNTTLRDFMIFCEMEQLRMQRNFRNEIKRLKQLKDDLEILNKN